jgi:hypothetical protein
MNNKKMPALKPIISVTEMAKMLNLSRARLYQLLEQGIFPQPIYDLRTHRPLYNAQLQERCLEIRNSGIGDNNQYILFYSPRKKETKTRISKSTKKTDSLHTEFAETLNSMGLGCSAKDVSVAISELYPDGVGELDHGVVIRDLFRFLESK